VGKIAGDRELQEARFFRSSAYGGVGLLLIVGVYPICVNVNRIGIGLSLEVSDNFRSRPSFNEKEKSPPDQLGKIIKILKWGHILFLINNGENFWGAILTLLTPSKGLLQCLKILFVTLGFAHFFLASQFKLFMINV